MLLFQSVLDCSDRVGVRGQDNIRPLTDVHKSYVRILVSNTSLGLDVGEGAGQDLA